MAQFFSNIEYAKGLELQAQALEEVKTKPYFCSVLGFEHKPVVTMGVRASLNDLLSLKNLKAHGFEVTETDRGGQSTLHMPGQLVIYPVLSLRDYQLSVRQWICLIAKASMETFKEFGVESYWDEARPGVYSSKGKLAALGVRIKQGISQHGVCINVHNSLDAYQWVVPCGVAGLKQDRLADWGYLGSLEELFFRWNFHFEFLLTSQANFTTLPSTLAPDVRS